MVYPLTKVWKQLQSSKRAVNIFHFDHALNHAIYFCMPNMQLLTVYMLPWQQDDSAGEVLTSVPYQVHICYQLKANHYSSLVQVTLQYSQ